MKVLLRWLWSEPAPAAVQEKARMIILDTLGCAIAAHGHPTVEALERSLGESPLARSAFLATAACWDEACEGLARAHGRPGVPVVAACLAFGESAALPELVDAVIAGYEVGGRMGETLRIKAGMHVDAGWPALGVAAAVTRLRGGSADAAVAAVDLAASQLPFGLYLPIEQGADGRNTYLGHAAWLGAYCALAVESGVRAPSGAVRRQAELALGATTLPDTAPHGEYLILEAYLKPFAAVRHVHYGAQAALELRGKVSGRIEEIELSIYPEALRYCGNRAPRTPIEAQFSLSFGVAAALRFGRLDAQVYRLPEFEDAELRRLEALVAIREGPAAGRFAKLALNDAGDWLECRIDAVKGDASMPFTRDDCLAKFLAGSAARLGEDGARALAATILDGEGRLGEVLG